MIYEWIIVGLMITPFVLSVIVGVIDLDAVNNPRSS